MKNGPMTVEELWRSRARAFRKETMPYVRYMLQSGLLAFMSLIFISSAIGYFSLIRDLPPQFPVTAVGVVSLMIVLCWSPLRTWLSPADTVFLMPREGEMDRYLRLSLMHSTFRASLLAACVLLLYLPIYRLGPGYNPAWVLTLAAAMLKAANLWGSWRERQMVWPKVRLLSRLLRWGMTALALTVWLTCVLWQAAVFTLLIGILMLVVYRLPRRQRFPWEQLIAQEQTTRKRYYLWFGMFIDVPTMSSSVSRRPYLSWLLRTIPYGNRSTYVLLYAAALLRMEFGGILVRLLMLGCLVLYWLADAMLLSGWGAAFVYGLFLGVTGVQLSSLRHVHRYTVWKHVYPLPEKQRVRQLIVVDISGIIVCALLLFLFLFLPLAWHGIYTPSVTALILTAIYIALRPMRIMAKARKEAEEE